jgi:hypothetical protein
MVTISSHNYCWFSIEEEERKTCQTQFIFNLHVIHNLYWLFLEQLEQYLIEFYSFIDNHWEKVHVHHIFEHFPLIIFLFFIQLSFLYGLQINFKSIHHKNIIGVVKQNHSHKLVSILYHPILLFWLVSIVYVQIQQILTSEKSRQFVFHHILFSLWLYLFAYSYLV